MKLPRFHLTVKPSGFSRRVLERLATDNGVPFRWWTPTWLLKRRIVSKLMGAE